jgi:3',5'-cyclic AMP phosphodiesterase CpdA
MTFRHRVITPLTILLLASIGAGAQQTERVIAITPPVAPLPPEAESRSVTRFSFVVYGDTRGRRDGDAIQYEHSLVVDSMLAQIKRLEGTPSPVRFILQSGDAVVNGQMAQQYNVSFVPLINRLIADGGVPYFLAPGNHEATTTSQGMRNYLDAVSAIIPPDGSPNRLAGYATYSVSYGNTFVLALDANIADDEKQFQWVKNQFEKLDRRRYVNIVVFCHQAPFSSGPHGGPNVEPATVALRTRYMPLFNIHHVRAVFSGHEHLFEHWVERYTDRDGAHRMDLVISGGGGAPLYLYTGEPDLRDFLKANAAAKVTLQHLVKPGREPGSNPYHYTIVHVDGDKLGLEVFGVDWGVNFQPYRSNNVDLQDRQ